VNRERKAVFYALSAVLIWSTVATALTMTLRYISKEEMLLWAFSASFAVLGSMVLVTKKKEKLKQYLRQHWRLALLLGTINPFIYYFTLFYAYELLPAQEAQAINYTWALMLAYLSVPILGHRLMRRDIVAGILCYFGVLIIATHGNLLTLEFSSAKGVLVALLSTVFWAFYWIIVAKLREDTVIILFSNFAVGLVWIVVYIFLSHTEIHMEPEGMLGALYIGLFEMGVTFVLWGKALAMTTRISSISTLIFLSPIFSLVLIYFVAGEVITVSTVVALALILFGLLIQQKNPKSGSLNA